MPRSIWQTFLKGLVIVLPAVLTAAILYWFGVTLERVMGSALRTVLPQPYYFNGLGILLGMLAVFLVGVASKNWLTQYLLRAGEAVLDRIPLAKSIYSSARDLMRFVAKASDPSEMKKVVLVTVSDGIRMIGFVTQDRLNDIEFDGSAQHVAVYLQMSYQMGGYTVLVPKERVQPLDMDLEEAMRWLLTAGMSSDNDKD